MWCACTRARALLGAPPPKRKIAKERKALELSAAWCRAAPSDHELTVPAGGPYWSEMVVLRVATTQFSALGDDVDANIRRAEAVVRYV